MVKIEPYRPLTDVLDGFIAVYKPPGRVMGKPNDNPGLSEDDLKVLIKAKGDREIAVPDDTYAFFMDYPNPQYEKNIRQAASSMFPRSQLISISGRFHYPKGGYMGWHSNSNSLGTRLYATYATEDDKSFFRYYDLDKKQMITEWEKKGWNFRAFQVKQEKLYWHCVYAGADRYSFGFRYQS